MSHTQQQLWEIYISKNPHWSEKNITLTPDGLRKLVEQSYQHGYKHGFTVSNNVNKNLRKNMTSSDHDKYGDDKFNDIFGNIFKGKL